MDMFKKFFCVLFVAMLFTGCNVVNVSEQSEKGTEVINTVTDTEMIYAEPVSVLTEQFVTKIEQVENSTSIAEETDIEIEKTDYSKRNGVVLTKEQALKRINTLTFDAEIDKEKRVSEFVNSNQVFMYRDALEDTTLYDILRNGLINGDNYINFDKGYTVDEIDYMFNCVTMDCPQILWYSNEYYYNDVDGLLYSCEPVYYNTLKKDKVSAIYDLELKSEPIIEAASALYSDIDKVKYIHDYIVFNTSLNDYCDYSQSAYSVIVNNEGLCSGYTKAFQYYMLKLGIPCVEVKGIGDGEAHSWVQVQIDGDWYELDVMWDDTDTDDEYDFTYYNFLNNRETFAEYHELGAECVDLLPVARGSRYIIQNYEYIAGSDNIDFDLSVYNVNNVGLLPKGWCSVDAVTEVGIDRELRVKDWTREYRYYYISYVNEPAAYYIYDISFDNYYIYNEITDEVQWFDYALEDWVILE